MGDIKSDCFWKAREVHHLIYIAVDAQGRLRRGEIPDFNMQEIRGELDSLLQIGVLDKEQVSRIDGSVSNVVKKFPDTPLRFGEPMGRWLQDTDPSSSAMSDLRRLILEVMLDVAVSCELGK